jgi:Zn-dependent membrane protease YugP
MIGSATHTRFVIFAGIGLMALGIVTHLVGYAVRFREARRAMRASMPRASQNRKGKKR